MVFPQKAPLLLSGSEVNRDSLLLCIFTHSKEVFHRLSTFYVQLSISKGVSTQQTFLTDNKRFLSYQKTPSTKKVGDKFQEFLSISDNFAIFARDMHALLRK